MVVGTLRRGKKIISKRKRSHGRKNLGEEGRSSVFVCVHVFVCVSVSMCVGVAVRSLKMK